MGTYVNNLRLLEITTGDESGTWGTKTNTNLELIADAFGSGTEAITTNADTHTTTIADGAADEGRAIFLKYTGTLDSACTITLAPNTVNKLWFIENATSGSQNIIISQGSGANITIGNGKVAAVKTDGAGTGASVLDAFADLELSSTLTVAGNVDFNGDLDVDGTTNLDAVDIDGAVQIDEALTVGVDDTGYDVKFFGATSGAYMLWDQSADDLILAGAAGLDVDGVTNLDAVDIDGAVQIDAAVTVGVDDTGYDVKFFGATASAYMLWDQSADDLILAGAAGLDVAGTTTLGGTLTVNAGAVFNEASADVDFRIEGNGEANLFFVDAGNDRIGINTNAPTAKLHILQSAADYDSGIKLVGSDSVISGRIWMGGGHLNIDNATAGTGTGFTLEDDGTLTYGGDFLDVADGVTTIGGTDTSKLQFNNAAGTLRSFLTLNSTSLEIDTDSAIIFSANNSERARIDDSGRLGLGTSAPHGYYSVSNKFVIANTGGSTGMTFATSNTGQARIDFAEGTSGGEQYRGTISYQHAATESEGYLRFVSAENEIFRMEGTIVTCGRTSANASTVDGHQWFASGGYYNYHAAGEVVRWYNTDNGNDVGSIDTSTSSTAYNTSSDRRLKENIEAADPSGSLLDSIEIVKHDWISSDDHVRYGVVAQDLFEVLPEAVSRGTDGDFVDEDLSKKEQPIKQVWGVDYSKLVPLLVKEVQDLRTRVAELEA